MDIFHFITLASALAVDVIEIKRGLNGDGSSATVCRTRHLLVFCASLSDERFSVDGGWMAGTDCDSHNPIFHRELYIVLLANVLKRISSSLSSSCGCCWTNQPASQQTKLTPQSTQNIDKIGTCWRSCGSLGIVNDAYYLLASSAVSRHLKPPMLLLYGATWSKLSWRRDKKVRKSAHAEGSRWERTG